MKQIPLTQGKFALVDDEDYDWLIKYKWYAAKGKNSYYAVRQIRLPSGKQRLVRMHRSILNINDAKVFCDHIDCNGLNNCRSNLRLCDIKSNAKNRDKSKNNKSGYKGVSLSRKGNSYLACIWVDGAQKYIKTFKCPIEAAKAYDAAAIKYYGEFARLNFPQNNTAKAGLMLLDEIKNEVAAEEKSTNR